MPTPNRDVNEKPLLYIARSFDINKPGTSYDKLVGGVIGGSVVKGIFKMEMKSRSNLASRSKTLVEELHISLFILK